VNLGLPASFYAQSSQIGWDGNPLFDSPDIREFIKIFNARNWTKRKSLL
jgi:hypothetical protein